MVRGHQESWTERRDHSGSLRSNDAERPPVFDPPPPQGRNSDSCRRIKVRRLQTQLSHHHAKPKSVNRRPQLFKSGRFALALLRRARVSARSGRAIRRDGVYGGTTDRRNGVRMALGADRRRIVKMVLNGAFTQVGMGLALGVPAAIGAGKLMKNQLFGVKPWDPIMLTSATVLLALTAMLASLIPARRAASVEP